MKDLKAIKGKYFIHRLIQEGEHEHQDFKFQISDARKIARSISAFANNDGGRLLIGVREKGAGGLWPPYRAPHCVRYSCVRSATP